MSGEIDTSNRFVVAGGARGDRFVILNPPTGMLSEDDALNLAAWLVALTGQRERFNELLDAVERT